jgi:hypothetical protein
MSEGVMTATTDQHRNRLLIAAYLIGAVIACVILFPSITSYPQGFIENFLYLYLPPVSIIFATHQISQKPIVVLSVALILSLYLTVFFVYAMKHPQHEFVFLTYLFSLPGSALGAVLGAICIRRNWITHNIYAPLFVAFSTLTGLALNQYYICSNFISCRL